MVPSRKSGTLRSGCSPGLRFCSNRRRDWPGTGCEQMVRRNPLLVISIGSSGEAQWATEIGSHSVHVESEMRVHELDEARREFLALFQLDGRPVSGDSRRNRCIGAGKEPWTDSQ